MPKHYDRYIEVFGGGGWVLFGKPPDKCMEVYNDFNSNLANLFYCVKERPMALLRELSFLWGWGKGEEKPRGFLDTIKEVCKIRIEIIVNLHTFIRWLSKQNPSASAKYFYVAVIVLGHA